MVIIVFPLSLFLSIAYRCGLYASGSEVQLCKYHCHYDNIIISDEKSRKIPQKYVRLCTFNNHGHARLPEMLRWRMFQNIEKIKYAQKISRITSTYFHCVLKFKRNYANCST